MMITVLSIILLSTLTVLIVATREIIKKEQMIDSLNSTLEAYEKEFKERFKTYNENHREG